MSTTVGAAVLHCIGIRWFEVETPSMGSAIPVGSLVVTVPARAVGLHPGEVIAFRPRNEPDHVYTHRIVSVGGGGITTRGDINGAADGWQVRQADLVGRSVLVLPGVGFLVRAVPLLLAGNAVVWLVTARIRPAAQRAASRNIGFSAVAVLPSFLLHPFVHVQVLALRATGDHLTVSVVSTGLLPVRVTATGSTDALLLRDGEVGTLALPLAEAGYRLQAMLALSGAEWVFMVGLCLLPLAWSVLVGLPAGSAERVTPLPAQRNPVRSAAADETSPTVLA